MKTMTRTTKLILSELQRVDSGEPLRLRLSPEIYPPAPLNAVRDLLDDPADLRPLADEVWELHARRGSEVLNALLVLTVRDLA